MVTLESVRLALGETGKSMSDTEIESLMATLDQLSDYWLDLQEIKIFGRTIKTLLDR